MATLAFLGLGQMGAPMAARLQRAGHDLTVWNRTSEKARPLEAAGAAVASSPAEAAGRAEAVITMLADPEAVEAVAFGPGGFAAGLGGGSAWIDMSTIGPSATLRLAGRVPHGVDVLDAPVRGSVTAATEGTLRIVVGATEAAFARWRPVLEAMGEPTRMGPVGAGAAAKLVNNLAGIASVTVLAEVLALADGLGLDPVATLDMLATSPAASVVTNLRPRIEAGSFDANFKASLAAKDLALAEAAATDVGLDARVAAAARSWFDAATEAGLGDLDWAVVTAFVRDRRDGAA